MASFECYRVCQADPRLAGVPTWIDIMAGLEAVRLTQLRARAGLVCGLTGIDKVTANRLYRQLHGRPSPAGQAPITDTWFLKSDQRLLHAALVWRFHQALSATRTSAARRLIGVHEPYRVAIQVPLLNITQVAFENRCLAPIGPVLI